MENTEKTPFVDNKEIYGKTVEPHALPEREIGVDQDNQLFQNIIEAGESSQLDITRLQDFLQISQGRDQVYNILDTMSEDPLIAAVLETYAEDATEANDEGKVIWAQSDDAEIGKYVTFLLDSMNVDKHIYKWVYSLCKYGDVYLHLYRQSECKDLIFDKDDEDTSSSDSERKDLNEDIRIKAYSENDKYVHYMEMASNPAEMFELTRFGKTSGYIKAPVRTPVQRQNELINTPYYRYSFQQSDIDIYAATEFVHGALEDNSSRTPEQVDIFLTNADVDSDDKITYTVKRGQSLLYNVFKIWRQLMLLENSVMLNRLTRSSIVRLINVEIGDMPKAKVGPHLQQVKKLIEQKSAISEGKSMSEYTNPGPVENNVYIPTHGGVGSITTQQVGGDVDVKSLADLDYFKNRLFGALRVPKQYFGETDDATGFNGGTSLTIISARYAKMIKRIQSTVVQMLTDAINLMLLDKKLDSYINKFSLHMTTPTTQEEIDRRDNTASKIGIVRDVMDILADIESPRTKLEIEKSLLSTVISDTSVIDLIQEEIDKLDSESEVEETVEEIEDTSEPIGRDLGRLEADREEPVRSGEPEEEEPTEEPETEVPEENTEEEVVLPTPQELGQNFVDNSQFA